MINVNPNAQQAPETVSSLQLESMAPFASAETQANSFAAILPLIAQQAIKTSKWVTVIGASREQIEALAESGVSRARIRWIQGKDNDQREWATEQAILAGTSGVVISWLDPVSTRMQQRIKMASRVSQTQSFVFSESTLRTPLH